MYILVYAAVALSIVIISKLLARLLVRSKLSAMQQFARNPGRMQAMGMAFAERENLLARATNLNEDELKKGVDAILSGDTNRATTWLDVFERVGPRAIPLLTQALSDPRCDHSIASEALRGPTPFEGLTRALASLGSPQAITALADWRESPQDNKRNHAIMCIAMTGNEQAVGSTCNALRSDAHYDRSYAQSGIGWAIRYRNISPAFVNDIVPEIERVLTGTHKSVYYQDGALCGTLLELDKGRALKSLQSPAILRPDNPLLYNVLGSLNNSGVVLPVTFLQDLVARAKTTDDRTWRRVHGESLRALVRASPDTARGEIEAALDSSERTVRDAAIEAFRELLKLPDPYTIRDTEEFDALPAPVQHVIAAIEFDNEVRNGGLGQYFFNSSGDHVKQALEGFRAMGATFCLETLEDAIKVLGEEVISPDRERRIKAYGRTSDQTNTILDTLNSRYYAKDESLQLCIVRYMQQHAEIMRKAVAD